MGAPPEDSLGGVLQKVLGCLRQLKVSYLIIGGVAQAVIGEPRFTQDVDCIIAVPPRQLARVLDGLAAAGFTVDRRAARERFKTTGTFNVSRGRWRVDFIVASTPFEERAFKRAQRLRLYDMEARLPTPEDLILLKLVPGREQDLLDAKTVMIRHRDRLDRAYLEHWAQQLSDEAEDSRVWDTLQRLLRDTALSKG